MEYDPLLAKLIGYGETREQAIGRLQRALGEYSIGGIKTNLPLFREILRNKEFASGNANTGFLSRMTPQPHAGAHGDEETIAVIAAGIFKLIAGSESAAPAGSNPEAASSEWKKTARSEGLR